MRARLISIAVVAAAASVVLLLAGALGTRFKVWPFGIGFALFALGMLAAFTALVLGAAGAWLGGARTTALAATVVAIAALIVPARSILAARGTAPIHDITTDVDDPPRFVALLPLRTGNVSPPEYDGPAAAEQQRRAYPDIRPLIVMQPPLNVFHAALLSARQVGWRVVSDDPKLGQIEAIDSTFWFGFEDDIVIRVRPDGEGTRVDVRSKSRVGVGDLGTNAKRIRAYLDVLRRRVS